VRDHDQQFFDSFMLVVGILIGVAVALFLIVGRIASDTQGEYVLDDPTVQAEIERRIAPVGQVVLLGSDELAAAAEAATAAAERADALPLTGPQVYESACFVCHMPPGVQGAPVLGDQAAWADRVAQGMDTLTQHVIEGFGLMPPKGGRTDLADEEIVAAIEHMLDQLE